MAAPAEYVIPAAPGFFLVTLAEGPALFFTPILAWHFISEAPTAEAGDIECRPLTAEGNLWRVGAGAEWAISTPGHKYEFPGDMVTDDAHEALKELLTRRKQQATKDGK